MNKCCDNLAIENFIIEQEKKQAKEIAEYIKEKINQKVFYFNLPLNITIDEFIEYINKGYFKDIIEIEYEKMFNDVLTQYFIITFKINNSDEKYYVLKTKESFVKTLFESKYKVTFDIKIAEISKENLFKAIKDKKIWNYMY